MSIGSWLRARLRPDRASRSASYVTEVVAPIAPSDEGTASQSPAIPGEEDLVDLAPEPPIVPLSDAQVRRAIGSVVAAASGDALGAGYVGRGPLAPTEPVAMLAAGGGAPGRWTAATEAALPVLEVLARGGDLLDPRDQDDVVRGWLGALGRGVLFDSDMTAVLRLVADQTARSPGLPPAQCARRSARRRHEQVREPVASGCLVPAAAAALGFLGADDGPRLTRAVRALVTLTHGSPDALAAALLWAHSVRAAVLAGPGGLDAGLGQVPGYQRRRWEGHVAEAAAASPTLFQNDGLAVEAVQVAWAALVSTANTRGGTHLERALVASVQAGGDAATTSWVTGALAGAQYGVAAVPEAWTDVVHGQPGVDLHDLATLAEQGVRASHERAVARVSGSDERTVEG